MTRAREFAVWTALTVVAAFGIVTSIASDEDHVTNRAVTTAQHGPICNVPENLR